MNPADECERLGRALTKLAHRTGQPLLEVSRALKFHAGYLSRAFRGRSPLRFAVVLRFLSHLGVQPDEYFDALYPFGGPAVRRARLLSPGAAQAQDELRDLERLARDERGEDLTIEALAERAGRLLREMLRRQHVSQQEASRRLGMGPHALGQALRSAEGLCVEHLFGVLAVTEISPARFFQELFGPPEADLLGAISWSAMLDDLEERLGPMMEGYLDRSGLALPDAKG